MVAFGVLGVAVITVDVLVVVLHTVFMMGFGVVTVDVGCQCHNLRVSVLNGFLFCPSRFVAIYRISKTLARNFASLHTTLSATYFVRF